MLTKGVFIKSYTCFLSFVASNQRALTPDVRRFFANIFPMSSSFCECDWPTSHGGARSPQHGDAIFKEKKIILYFIYLLVSRAADQRVC